ncbi:MAG TPA: DUF1329 domain-containing protein [Dongiaceae bacterium]|nr:DUF1329 domain-containing protein [Dongiaceae bacterium]
MKGHWLIPLILAGLLATAAQGVLAAQNDAAQNDRAVQPSNTAKETSAAKETTARDATRLQKDLTPIGAERAGNRDGSIPAWNADQLGDDAHLQWLQQITTEEPLFIIDQSNLAQYRDQLSVGLQAMFARYPDSFAIPVYKTRRTARQPQWTYDNTRRNLADARISESGDEILQAWPGTPFPIPHSPHEVMWNHQLRWKGIYLKLHLYETTVFSTQAQAPLETLIESWASFYDPTRQTPQLDDWRAAYYFSRILGPAKLAGGGLLIHSSLQPKQRPSQAWVYLAGERRMRRSPVLGYDSPIFNSEGLRVVDEIDIFNGALDRYEWKLLGKRELFIPYNNQKMRYNRCDDSSALDRGHLKPYTMRFEKHRVWVVDATLKPGFKHLYPRRTFYLDEDTWSIALVDIYDKNGKLWRNTMRFAAYYEAMPGIFSALDSFHDLKVGAFFLQCSAGQDTSFSQENPQRGYFAPTNIRQRLRR